jgi:hypothetical protein
VCFPGRMMLCTGETDDLHVPVCQPLPIIHEYSQSDQGVSCEVCTVRPGIRICGFYSQRVSVQFPMAF